MKKIINKPETVVVEMCNGLVLAYPELEFLPRYKIIKKKVINKNKVSLISGGGSGHEPAHAGYVGKGMLDAAICGDVFASPSQIQVYQGIRETASDKGTLLIIKNYSGDIMNFTNAAEMAKEEGINVDYIKVEDDIAVKDSLYTVGRRGVAGTVLVHKVAGAAAEEGLDLQAVKEIGQHAANNVRTIGFALDSCVVPASGVPTFEISDGEMEYGVGIHGEPGKSREKAMNADELANRMVNELVRDLNVSKGDEVTLLVNGFGGTPLQEIYLFNNAVYKVLDSMGIKVYRCFAGNFMTSIDMLGASVTIMKMDDLLKKYLDMPSYAPGFPVKGPVESVAYKPVTTADATTVPDKVSFNNEWKKVSGNAITLDNITAMVYRMMECIIENEVHFCKLDSYAGDGDFGASIAKGFLQVKREWDDILEKDHSTIKEFLIRCSLVIMEYCGGASGPIWGSAFRAAGIKAGNVTEMSLKEFADMMQATVKGIQVTGERSFGRGAVVGDKTLIDALVPCADTLSQCASQNELIKDALHKGAEAAVKGAESTKDIVARMGRAGVVGERSLGYPDAGAYALGVIFTDVANFLIYE
ncbi:MAG: dihydroxyacetone kinase subunit DhaK [Clostridiaceae bacterium]|nr:dihydroxyacetone kinase subunit DhaK [Clostridiaceae bacterium]